MKDWWSVLLFAGMFVVIFVVIPLGISWIMMGGRRSTDERLRKN